MSKSIEKTEAFELFKRITLDVESIRNGTVEPRTIISRNHATGHFSVEVRSGKRTDKPEQVAKSRS